MAISFVGAGAVATGTAAGVSVPAGVIADDLLLIVSSGTATPTTPTGWTLLSAQGAGQFITIYYRYAGTTNSFATVSSASTSTKAVMLAYRGTGAFQAVPAYTTGTGTTATPNTLTTTYANDFVVSIYASAQQATVANWTPDAATTSRLNSSNSSTVKGLLIADELQAAAGVSTARAATLSASDTWSSVAIALVEQRTLYWIGGTGTWNATFTANWSDVSGGSAASLPPSIADNTVIDTFSGTGTITCTGGVGKNLTVTATQAITLGAINSTLTIYGSLTFPTGGSFVRGGANQFTITFAAVTTGNTVTLAGRDFGDVTFNGIGGEWTLQDTFTVTDVFILSAGSLVSNNQILNFGNTFAMSGSGVKAINLGSSTVTVSGPFNQWTVVSTNTTFNAGTSTITIVSQIGNFTGGGVTYYNVTFPTGSQPNQVTSFTGANTFNTLTFQRSTNSSIRFISFDSNQNINNLVVTGSSATSRISLGSNSATPKIFTVNTSASVANADFGGITISGAAAPISGTNLGDNGNNSGITFPAAKTVYWNLAGSQIWSAAGWATSSGGTPNINNFPLAQDTAVFNNASTVTGTISVDQYWSVGSVDTSTRTSAMTIAHNNGLQVRAAGVTLSSAVTMTGSVPIFFYGTTGTQTFTQNGANLSGTVGITLETATAATAVLGGPTTSTLGTVTVNSGGFNLNGFNLTCPSFLSSNGNVRTITLGTSTVNITSAGGGTVWNFTTSTNLTFSGASSTINLTNDTVSNRTIALGTATYGTINIAGATAVNSGTAFAAGTATIGTLSSTKPVAHRIIFSNLSVLTINNWTVTGTAGNVVTVESTLVGTQRTITYGGSQINLDYMSFTDINMSYTLGASNPYLVYAGANSTNGGNNNGIAFIDGTTKKAYRLTTGTSWTVPGDWNSSNNTIHMIGAGGGGATGAVSGNNRAAGGGGGGGGYTVISNYTATPSSSVAYQIGAAASNVNGGDTGIGQSTISFVASTTLADTAGSTTHVMNVPSGTANGDLMVLFIAASSTTSYTVPTGWTQAFNNIGSCMICYRTASSEPASYTVTTSTLPCTGYIATYRNAAFDVVGTMSSTANPTVAPSITVTYANSIVLDFAIARSASVTFTTPTGFSSVASESNTTNPSSALFSGSFNAGATGTVSTTPSSGNGFSILLAIKPTPAIFAGGGRVGTATTAPLSTGGAGGTGTYAGGSGGVGAFGTTALNGYGSGGGGGAGGPNGVGGSGGTGFANLTQANTSGGGGGGNGGGANGTNGSLALGGNGGNNFAGTGGAIGGSGTGAAGTFGGGGAGAAGNFSGGLGGSGRDIENTIGGGGGRGGSGGNNNSIATITGLYGGGGAGAGVQSNGLTTTGAPGSQGVIFIVYTPSGGSTSVTVNLTGVSATVQLGTSTVTGTAAVNITGLQATTFLGTATVDAAANVYPTGPPGTGVLGSVTVAGDAAINLTGVEGTTVLGTVTAFSDIAINVSGVQGDTALGTATATGTANVDLTGLVGTTALGTPTVIGDANIDLSGVQGNTDLGTVSLITNNFIDVTGLVGTTQLGTASVQIDVTPAITGVEANGQTGTVTVNTDQILSVTGVQGDTELGVVSLITNNFIDVTGLVGTAQLGTADVSAGANAFPVGVEATGQIGTVDSVIGNANVFPIGVQATVILNLVNVWGNIVPIPTSPWDPVNASQTENWVIIDKAAG